MTSYPNSVILFIEREVKIMDTIREAYRIVLNDILNNDCKMFVGEYNAENGSVEFMYGILAVMEYLAYNICDEEGDAFSNLFTKNMPLKLHEDICVFSDGGAELSNCYKGQHGGKKNCRCFSPNGD